MVDEVHVIRAGRRLSLDQVADLAEGPLRAAGAERAVAFGSWARGSADGFSDLDLVVVLETTLPRAERARALTALLDALPIELDLIVYTPAEFARGVRDGYGVFDSIAREGITIYARSRG